MALNKIKTYVVYKGSSFYNAAIASKGIFIGDYMKKWAAINAYDDAFIIAALFVGASIIPAFMLRNIIYRKSKAQDSSVIESD